MLHHDCHRCVRPQRNRRLPSGILRGRDSLRYFDGELEGGGSVRTGDFRFAAGERTIDEGSELLPERLFFFNRDRVARDLPVDPAVNFAALSLII